MSAVNAIHTQQYELVNTMGLGVLLQVFIRKQIPGSKILLGKTNPSTNVRAVSDISWSLKVFLPHPISL
jgi:hypothetical protein